MKKITIIIAACLSLLAANPCLAKSNLHFKVEGLDAAIHDNVIARLKNAERRLKGELNETHIKEIFANATNDINDALKPFGYFKPKVDATLTQTGDRWDAKFHIYPGPPVKISEVNIEITGQVVVEKQIVLAGYRLAGLLNRMES